MKESVSKGPGSSLVHCNPMRSSQGLKLLHGVRQPGAERLRKQESQHSGDEGDACKEQQRQRWQVHALYSTEQTVQLTYQMLTKRLQITVSDQA